MKKLKFLGSFFVVATIFAICFSINAFAHAYTDTASSYGSTVYVGPDSATVSVGSIGAEGVKVFWQENGYYYIEYTVGSGAYGGYKRGYVPAWVIPNVGGVGGNPYPAWGSHAKWDTTVYDRPDTASLSVGTVWSSDDITILAEEGNWNYIQYPTSSGYKRGYVYKDYIYATLPTNGIESGNVFYIKNVNSGRYLDVENNANYNGARVQQWQFNGGMNQQWQVEYLPNEGLYKLHPLCASDKSLDVLGASMNNGDSMDIWDGDYPSTKWYILRQPDGSFRLYSNCSERTKAMVVEASSMDSGANVIQWEAFGGANEEWVLEYKKVITNSDVNINSGLNRTGAFNYMITYGNYGSGYSRNAIYKDVGADCTTFVSQCIGDANAGNLPQIGSYFSSTTDLNNWFYAQGPINSMDMVSNTWSIARDFRLHWVTGGQLRVYKYVEYPCINNALSDMEFLYTYLQRGDIFQVIYPWQNEAHHSMIVQDFRYDSNGADIVYAQHQDDRKDQSLRTNMLRWNTDSDLKDNKIGFIIIKYGY